MPIQSPEPDKILNVHLITVQQVADWVKVSPKTVYRWMETGRLSCVRFGRRTYRIPVQSVIDYLRSAGYDHLINAMKQQEEEEEVS